MPCNQYRSNLLVIFIESCGYCSLLVLLLCHIVIELHYYCYCFKLRLYCYCFSLYRVIMILLSLYTKLSPMRFSDECAPLQTVQSGQQANWDRLKNSPWSLRSMVACLARLVTWIVDKGMGWLPSNWRSSKSTWLGIPRF